MEDPRGRDCAGAGAGGGLRLFLSLGGNRRPFNQTAEIEKQTRTLIIQRRGGEEKGGEGQCRRESPKKSSEWRSLAWHFARTPFHVV